MSRTPTLEMLTGPSMRLTRTDRWPAVMYTSEGHGLRERVWAETKREPGFAEAFEAVENM